MSENTETASLPPETGFEATNHGPVLPAGPAMRISISGRATTADDIRPSAAAIIAVGQR